MRLHLGILGLSLVLPALALCAGCKTSVKGGESRHETGDLQLTGGQRRSYSGITRLSIGPDGRVVIEQVSSTGASTQPSLSEKHDNTATTQPSIETTNGRLAPNLGASDEGQLGGVSFTQLKEVVKKYPERWALAGILVAVGLLSIFVFHFPAVGILSMALAIPTVLMPGVVGGLCLAGVILYVILRYRSTIVQLVHGNQNAIRNFGIKSAAAMKEQMERAHDGVTKRLVSAMKK